MHLVSVHFPACPTPLTLLRCQTKPTSSHLRTLKLISLTGQSAYFSCTPVSSCPTSCFPFFEIMERFVNQGDYSASAGGHEQASRVAGWLGKKGIHQMYTYPTLPLQNTHYSVCSVPLCFFLQALWKTHKHPYCLNWSRKPISNSDMLLNSLIKRIKTAVLRICWSLACLPDSPCTLQDQGALWYVAKGCLQRTFSDASSTLETLQTLALCLTSFGVLTWK